MPQPIPLRLLRPAEPSHSARSLPLPAVIPSDIGARRSAGAPLSTIDFDHSAASASEFSVEAGAPPPSDRAMVLDCLRVRDLGGDWLAHPSFDLGAHSDNAHQALIRDGLAAWGDFGIHITPRGRREWADQRNALRDLSSGIEGAA